MPAIPEAQAASGGARGADALLRRQIGLYAATAVTIGSIVGSGIFRSPHTVAQEIHSVPVTLFAWILGGFLSMCGSFVLAELAVTHPRTGGLYVFIRESFGDRLGFVFGWASLTVIKPTVIASITTVFALYFCQVLGLPDSAQLPVGLAAILLLTLINWLGVKQGAGTQTLLTTAKIIGILGLCAAAFLLPRLGPDALAAHETSLRAAAAAAGTAPETPHLPHPIFLALALSMIPIFFAYDGWTDSTYVAGEVLNPRRAMPIAILLGTVIVIAVYVLTNLAYFHLLTPVEVAMKEHQAVGSEAMFRVLGQAGSRALAVLVAISTFGTISASVLTGPRVTLAMAADGLFWRRAAHVSKRGTPDFALWLQAVLSGIWLWCAHGFEDVSGWFVTTSWLFYGLVTAAIFVHRRRAAAPAGAEAAGYRTPLYPMTPILFILVVLATITSDLISGGWRSAAGVGIAATGFVVYEVTRRR
jgi:basic amino acid/polyamine antiporter, APA family